MTYSNQYRFSVHGVFINSENKVLLLKANYGNYGWGLPGGGLEPGETIHVALERECREELGVNIAIIYMSGLYFHKKYHSQVCIFKCEMPANATIQLSEEHSEYRYFTLDELSEIQRHRVLDCLQFNGKVKSAAF